MQIELAFGKNSFFEDENKSMDYLNSKGKIRMKNNGIKENKIKNKFRI